MAGTPDSNWFCSMYRVLTCIISSLQDTERKMGGVTETKHFSTTRLKNDSVPVYVVDPIRLQYQTEKCPTGPKTLYVTIYTHYFTFVKFSVMSIHLQYGFVRCSEDRDKNLEEVLIVFIKFTIILYKIYIKDS